MKSIIQRLRKHIKHQYLYLYLRQIIFYKENMKEKENLKLQI